MTASAVLLPCQCPFVRSFETPLPHENPIQSSILKVPLIENDRLARLAAFLARSKPSMNHLDKKITEMQEQLAVLHRQREAARLERAKSYADAFIRKLEANDIPLAVGLQAFQDLSKFSRERSTSST